MRALNLGILIAAGGLLLWLFGLGGMDLISHWAALQQREAQTALAAGLRAVRAGEPGAWITLMGVCASYGFFHAAGPGHGKLLIGGYGAAARVTALRLSTLAVISSLAQALTAIMLVGAGALVLGWSRARMTDTAEQVLAPASYGAIAMVGVWLAWRGLRRVRSVRAAAPVAEDGTCHSCGHAHGPSVDQVAESDLVAGCCCDCRIGRDAALYGGSFLADPVLWPWHSAGWHCWCDGDGFGDGQRNRAGCDIGCWNPTFCSGRLVRFRCRACNRTDRNCCRRGDRGDRYHTLGTLSVTLRTGFVCCPRCALPVRRLMRL